jgi:hypothetical protein
VTARFASNLAVLVLGVVLAPARFAFAAGTVGWLTFGVGAAMSAVVAAAFLVRGRGPVQRALDLLIAVTGSWTAVSALVFPAPVVGWLALAEGGALGMLAVIGLVAHEVAMERPFRLAQHQAAADGLRFSRAQRRPPVPVAPWPS